MRKYIGRGLLYVSDREMEGGDMGLTLGGTCCGKMNWSNWPSTGFPAWLLSCLWWASVFHYRAVCWSDFWAVYRYLASWLVVCSQRRRIWHHQHWRQQSSGFTSKYASLWKHGTEFKWTTVESIDDYCVITVVMLLVTAHRENVSAAPYL